MRAIRNWRGAVLPLCAIAFLWFRLLDHLRVEWAVNPQYGYGWAVPFLSLYLLWRSVSQKADGKGGRQGRPEWEMADGRWKPGFIVYLLVALCALAYAPTRLVEEANPEWRLVSWTLALEVVGLTLLLLQVLAPFVSPPSSLLHHLSSSLVFPVGFFLVAVPWPTVVEGPLIQLLTRANAASTVEVLGWLGVPAIQHGNVIEVGSGVVGIGEACSGIRSFQATLMISLFFGEFYRLSLLRRIGLCLSGFAFSFLFNVARTTLLTFVAAQSGTAAMARWHDPAGVAILVGCFLALWLLALGWQRGRREEGRGAKARMEDGGGKMEENRAEEDRGIRKIRGKESVGKDGLGSQVSDLKSQASAFRHARLCGLGVLLWVLVVEVGTEGWYRFHERHLPPPVTWTVALPREKAGFREVPQSENARQLLRYDEAQSAAWEESDGCRVEAFFFRWNAGRIAVHLAKTHTPAVCLTASGHELVSQTEPRAFAVHGLRLPFRSYVFKDAEAPLHVYYCLWEDRAPGQSFGPTTLSYQNRLAPVLAGCRNSGQRSLELALWGMADDQEADVEFQRQLERLMRASIR